MEFKKTEIMRIFFIFIAYVGLSLIISALLTPTILNLLPDDLQPSPDRLLYRFAMVLMIVNIPLLLKYLALHNRQNIGFNLRGVKSYYTIGKGFIVGIFILLILVSGLLLLDARLLITPENFSNTKLAKIIITGIISGLLVGLIEESFFRGMMFSAMRRVNTFWTSAILVSILYAAIHFIRPSAPQNDYSVTEAMTMIGNGLMGLFDLYAIHDSLIALFFAGLFLAMVRERTGNIYWVLGIHAGWVTVIKVSKYLSSVNEETSPPFWVGTYDGMIGYFAIIWLSTLCLGYWWLSRPK